MKKTSKKICKKKNGSIISGYAYNRKYIKPCDINFDVVYKMAFCQSTKSEIFAVMRILNQEIYADANSKYLDMFNDAYFSGLEAGKQNLRQKQYEMALDKPIMSIFVGKQYLGQSDNPNQLASAELGTLKVEFVSSKEESQEERIKRIESSLNDELK